MNCCSTCTQSQDAEPAARPNPVLSAQLGLYLSVADEGHHGGQAGLDALMPRQLILLKVVQELVQDPTETRCQPQIPQF